MPKVKKAHSAEQHAQRRPRTTRRLDLGAVGVDTHGAVLAAGLAIMPRPNFITTHAVTRIGGRVAFHTHPIVHRI